MPHQLDIFDDSRDVGLRSALAHALLDGRPAAAQAIAQTLQAEFGDDPVLAPAAALIEHLVWQQSTMGPLDMAAFLAARGRLEGTITAAATAALGARDAAAWLPTQWRWLADRAAAVGWQPAQADAHAAALYLRAQAWQPAAAAVACIASWRRIPLPLLWMTQARWRGEGPDAAWPLLADQPLLAAVLEPAEPPAQSAPAQAFGVVMALLRLERQGRHHEIVAQRARLRAL